MKSIYALIAALALFCNVHAQTPCATQMPQEMLDWLRNHQANRNIAVYKSSNGITYLPIKIHIVGNDNGAGYYKISSLLDAMCKLNEQYAPYDWQFYIYQDINYINSEALNKHTGNYQSIINSESVLNVANMFFVDDPSGACGYYYGGGGPGTGGWGGRQGFVAINESCAGPENSTIAHELGHFFSLPHTFSGWEGRSATDAPTANDERVDGSNCGFAGDGFCDTPADYLSDRWNCPYSGTKTDFAGDPYNPDGRFYMSYSNDACTQYHSPEQVDAIKSFLVDRRSYMLMAHDSFPEITDTVKALFPANGVVGVPVNYINLKWSSVPGATHYSLQVTRSSNGTLLDKDTILTDTSVFISGLAVGYQYRWRVRAFNAAETCSPYTNFSTFRTRAATALTPTFDVVNVTCSGNADGAVQVLMSGGTPPYTYAWADGSTSNYLDNLSGGNYVVTVTDASGDSIILSVGIAEPKNLEVDIAVSGNNLVPQVKGGTPIYSYNWSTGNSANIIPIAGDGSYVLTVTDAKGCSVTETFAISDINELSGIARVNVYPNPAATGTILTVDVEALKNFNGSVQILDQTGRTMATTGNTFQPGLNRVTLNLSNISAGVYFVKIVGSNVSLNKKVVLF
ncbi:MAG: T9SS type A sorting domain-containing protein [Chitinophagales bacterium]|nr:T9SS type A sorting domain-containing protein [Chitinophagales bacterium]